MVMQCFMLCHFRWLMCYFTFQQTQRQHQNSDKKKAQNWICYHPKVERMKGRLSSSFVNMSCCAMMHGCMMTIQSK